MKSTSVMPTPSAFYRDEKPVPATHHPDETWVTGQAEAFARHIEKSGLGGDIAQHDRDSKFTATFDARLKQSGLRIAKSAYRSPNTAAFVERFIQTLQQECLDYFFVFGERHMNYLCSQFVEHYHAERPHQGLENELILPAKKKRKREADVVPLSEVACKSRLGGLLKHYYRKAA
jgi:putative transposase